MMRRKTKQVNEVSVSRNGTVYYKSRSVEPFVKRDGHKYVLISSPDYVGEHRVASLVAEAFLGACPKDHAIYFRDGNPANVSVTNIYYDVQE